MKSLKLIFPLATTLFSMLPSISHAEIRELNSMKDLSSFVDSDTVLVFDLDNTLMEPVQSLGSDQFFTLLLQKAKSQGLDDPKAFACAIKNATLVQPVSKARPVEALIPGLLSDLQNQKIKIMGLTARPMEWKQNTIAQLNSIGIDLTKSPLINGDVAAGPGFGGIYYGGVMFMDKTGDKGEYLVEFLKQAQSTAKSVIFVDDKLNNIKSVEKALDKTSLQHIGFRYGAADPEVRSLDPKVAGFEWKYFLRSGTFISDAQAKSLMMNEGDMGNWDINCQ